MIWLMCLMLFQDLDLSANKDWVALARPWMTTEEGRLFDQLSPTEQRLFRGYFVARRLERPEQWPATGQFLPCFYAPAKHGDVRDQILYALGEPRDIQSHPLSPTLPRAWLYQDFRLLFESLDGSHVAIAEESREDWDRIKQGYVVNADIRYNFSTRGFGRLRLPEDIKFKDVQLDALWQVPRLEGGLLRMHIAIPESYREKVRRDKLDAAQHVELLLHLRRVGDIESEPRVYHSDQLLNIQREGYFTFEVYVPSGHHEVEAMVYAPRFDTGLRARTELTVLPREVPRIGDPIVSYEWARAGIEQFGGSMIGVGDNYYKSSAVRQDNMPGRVLVFSTHEHTEVWLQDASGERVSLKMAERDDNWWVFELPARKGPFRLLSLGDDGADELIALGADQGLEVGREDTGSPRFQQAVSKNYLALEELVFEAPEVPCLLFVNERPFLASRSGRYTWLGMDWGKVATFRFEYERDGQWLQKVHKLRRGGVFEQISVKPRYIVAATRRNDGFIEPKPLTVSVVGQPVKVIEQTPLARVPALWGIVVNDTLLKSPAWQQIKNQLRSWLRDNTHAQDEIYLVHNGERPQLVLEPTAHKPLVDAALESLSPRTRNSTYFTLKYLIDAITHMELHQTRPHQVLLLTDRLTGEIAQMEELIPRLRATGLQLYNLEFPVAGDSADPIIEEDQRQLATMEQQEFERERARATFRDNFQDDRDGVRVGSIRLGGKKARRALREANILEASFQDAFNKQLGMLTAGLAFTSGPGDTVLGLNRFFQELTDWQRSLVHLKLSVPYLDEDLVKVTAPDGYVTSWTLVEWSP